MSHFYDASGNAVFEVPNASRGGMRPTRITDCKKLGLYPSVTTIFDDVLAKKALQTWRDKQITSAAFLTQPKPQEFPEAYHTRIMEAAFKQVDDAADLGTRIHKALELHFDGIAYDNALRVYVEAVDDWIADTGIQFSAKELRLVNKEYGYAGTTDAAIVMPGKRGILDYKSRKTKPGKPVEPYETQPMQCAAYGKTYFNEPFIGCNLYISTTEPGRVDACWYDEKQMDYEFEKFKLLVKYWQMDNGYTPPAQ